MNTTRLLMTCASLYLSAVVTIDASQLKVDPASEQFNLSATASHKKYRIVVDVPREPAPVSGYPVIYVLDGDTTFLIAAGASRILATTENGLGPALVVAIGYDEEGPQVSSERYFDFTPQPSNQGLHEQKGSSTQPLAGGADNFIRFLHEDLKPLIKQRYKINDERQALVGHSLSGLFVLYAAFSSPNLFSHYVAGSPSVWWDARSILKRAEIYRQSSGDGVFSRLLISVGAEEPAQMVDGARELAQILQNDPKLDTCFVEFAGEDHMSVIPATISRSIRFALSQVSCQSR